MGTGPGWTASHQHWQCDSCSSMLWMVEKAKNNCIMYNIVCTCILIMLIHLSFPPPVKNKPYKPMGTIRLFLREVLSQIICITYCIEQILTRNNFSMHALPRLNPATTESSSTASSLGHCESCWCSRISAWAAENELQRGGPWCGGNFISSERPQAS